MLHCFLCRVSVSGLLAEQPRNLKQHAGSEEGAPSCGTALLANLRHVPSVFLPMCLYRCYSQNRPGIDLLKNTFSLNTFFFPQCSSLQFKQLCFFLMVPSVQGAPADLPENPHYQRWGRGDRQSTRGLLVFFHLVTYFMGRNKASSIERSIEQQMPNSGFK